MADLEARLKALQDFKAAADNMERETWLAKMRQKGVDDGFATALADTFGEYPGIEIVKALWDSDWGREAAADLGITELQLLPQMRQLVTKIRATPWPN